jgi:hypothetical protein
MFSNRTSTRLNQSRHIAMALCTFAYQQQVASFDCPGEIGDGNRMTAFAAPDICEQQLFAFTGNGSP